MIGYRVDYGIRILVNLQNQIIKDDLVGESDVYSFGSKAEWYRLWREEMERMMDAEEQGELFWSWEPLKETVVRWMRNGGNRVYREGLLKHCCGFQPYRALPGWRERDPQRIRLNSHAWELTLQKICILLGFEEDAYRAYLGDGICEMHRG